MRATPPVIEDYKSF